MNAIKDVKLFKKLKKKDKYFASKVLEASNNIEELINKKTTINFPNYTNHDMRHSINIMDTMYELIKQNIDDFNQLELSMMIYAALFHDIGMSINDNEIKKIKNSISKYLFGQKFDLIKKNIGSENLALQDVVRSQHGKISNDLIVNEYSEYFKLPNTSISFAKEIGMICQSHTETEFYLDKLPVEKIKGEYSCNPQFIAILLRVADILDIDATRTPYELYKNINLNEYSNEEWLKNLSVENTKKIFKHNHQRLVKLEGNVKDIKVHRKLLNYVQWIENELAIAVEKTTNMKKKYQLHLNTKVQNNIQPIGYTVPDLKLNIDYKAVTNLLMGESIYGSKNLGLRELIQNSIDACMIKKEKVGDSYKPIIEINICKEKDQVIIKDNGLGMNESIIKKYFLNVGKSYYKSPDFLNYEHNYNPIGNFGIGFLSCFMLSPHVQVNTKYHEDKYRYSIDLEQDSEYISFSKKENYAIDSGTEIILNYQSFLGAMNFKEEDLKILLAKFIDTHILIEGFDIKINNKSIKQKQDIKKGQYSIDINKYAPNLFGTITLNLQKFQDNLQFIFHDSYAVLYYNGNDFIKLSSIQELDFDKLISNNTLEYCSIPLLSLSGGEKFDTLIEAYTSEDDAITSLDYEIEGYIYLFMKKNCSFGHELSPYNNAHSIDEYLSIFTAEDEEKEIDIETIIQKANIKHYCETRVFITEKFFLIYNNPSSFLKFNNRKYFSNVEYFLKNISIQRRHRSLYDSYFGNFIDVSSIFINIKDNNIFSDIARKSLTSDSEQLLSYTISKIIHEFALENFDLLEEKKALLKQFIDKYYSEDSVLLNNDK